MATLVFFDKNHEYKLDGETIPSVSEILRFISREIYGNVVQFNLDRAAERGRKIHKITEVLDKYGEAEVPEDLTGYINAYVKFHSEHEVKWEKIEYATHHNKKTYAGTIDRCGVVDGTKALVEIKTSSVIQKQLVTAQLTLYDDMLEKAAEELRVLHLKPDGTYKYILIPRDTDLANACLILHDRLKKNSRKKKENKV